MTPQDVILQCSALGVSVHLNGDSIRLRGAPDAIKTVSDVVRTNKAMLIEYLANLRKNLIHEFMEVDGLSLEDADAIAAVSVQPRSADEWLGMISELEVLIDRYCATNKLTSEARKNILTNRFIQSLGSMPDTLAWFKTELSTDRAVPAYSNER